MKTHPYIWAKQKDLTAPYPLLAHLLDSATTAGVLYDHWLRPGLRSLLEEELGDKSKKILMWLAATHDIGKASPLFQYQHRRKGPEWDSIRAGFAEHTESICSFGDLEDLQDHFVFAQAPTDSFLRRHEQVSGLALLGGRDRESGDSASRAWQALTVLGHHGRFLLPQFGGPASAKAAKKLLTDLGWQTAQNDLLGLLKETLELSETDFPRKVSPTVIILLSGLVILADRIASGTDWVLANQELMANDQLSLDRPAQWIQDCTDPALTRVEQTLGIYRGWDTPEAAHAAILGDYEPRPLQTQALQAGSGLWNAMAPTGNGKTEAALLRHSQHDERLIFLLPTQATTNALMRRVQKAYAQTGNVASLAHGLASIEDFYTNPVTDYSDTCDGNDSGGLYPTEFVKSGASRLLAPVCVGTIDQSLMASIPLKWTHLRLLALANSHIVIDEIHTLDHYQSELLIPILEWLGKTRTRVTFLSATFPSWQRTRFVEAYTGTELQEKASFPSAEDIAKDGQIQDHALKVPEYTIRFTFDEPPFASLVDAHVEWACTQRRTYPESRIGIICNTVARAQEVAQALTSQGEQVILLHSRMTAEHRKRNAELLESLIGAQGQATGLVVVGTQAIEASLDIDLDVLSTDLCPAPSLIQRAGRVWRRQDSRRAHRVPGMKTLTINVVKPSQPEKFQLLPYSEAELLRTWRFLKAHPQFTCPNLNQEFVDASVVDLESIGKELDLMEADLDKLAIDSKQLVKGKTFSKNLAEVIKDTSRISAFTAITDPTLRDDDDQAFTHLIEADVRLLILAGDPQQIPGAWQGTYEDLLSLQATDQDSIRLALKASMPVTVNSSNRELLNQAKPLDQAASVLKRYSYLQIQPGQTYDHILGFRGNTA